MKNSYNELLRSSLDCLDDGIRFNFLVSILRSLSQAAVVTAFEIYRDLEVGDDGIDINAILRRLHSPSDGDPVEILDQIIPRVRSLHWPSFAAGWFEALPQDPGKYSTPLVSRLNEWVSFRNDRPGHGVMDRRVTQEWVIKLPDLVRHALEALADCLPKITHNPVRQVVSTPQGDFQIYTPLTHTGKPIVIRKFRNKRGVWSLDGQVLDLESSQDLRLDIPVSAPTVTFEPERSGKFLPRKISSKGKGVYVLANVPNRQSAVFEGRDAQAEELFDWIFDRESRACLVYGDGGVGKTTLVLEVINNLLEDDVEPAGDLPEVVSFYSAKLTRWTENGIVHFKGISPVVEDAIRDLILCVNEPLGADWYRVTGRALIDRVAATLSEVGLTRDDVLLILDNTETLARKSDDENSLARLVEQISRKVARVLLTSRRREKVEAKPIELLPLGPDEGAKLLARLASEYKAVALETAGDIRLRKIAKDLGGKPLLLDVLARHIGLTGGSINDAYGKVMQESVEGLSEFLYEDAWLRIPQSHRDVFLVLTCVSVPVDNRAVALVCRELEVPHTEWLNSFYETHFGQIIEYGSDYDIQFEPMATDFFAIKLRALAKGESYIKTCAHKIDDMVVRAEQARKEYVSDRVSEAFRSPSAKAAKVAAAKNQLDDAKAWYQDALNEDPHNSYLHDRFAWFLLVKCRDPGEAENVARRAVALDAGNADANLTLALVLYRQGRLEEGDGFVARAVSAGKPEGLGLLRMGIARFYEAMSRRDLKERFLLLEDAGVYLRNARRKFDRDNPYFSRNIDECDKYTRRVAAEVYRLKFRGVGRKVRG